jgi:mRNA interferase MazF
VVQRERCRALGGDRRRWAELMRRGEIRLVDLEPVRGAEANKRRPAVIVSNDGANSNRPAPGPWGDHHRSGDVEHGAGLPVSSAAWASDTGLDRDSKAQAEQVRSVAVERIGARVGIVPPERLVALDEALRLHLAL